MASMLQQLPIMWTGAIALVCGVIFSSASLGSMVSESSTSAMTGIALTATTSAAVAKNVYPGTITSSPGPTSQPTYAALSAEVPEFTANA